MKNLNSIKKLLLYIIAPTACFLSVKSYAQQAGTLDSTFGMNGMVYCQTNFLLGSPYSVMDAQYRVVSMQVMNASILQIFRHNPDGLVDTTFGNNGQADYSFGDSIYISFLQIQKDDKILCAGSIQHLPDTILDNQIDFFITRFLPDGSLDSSFADQGQLIIDLGLNETLGGLTLQEDSAILLSGNTNNVGWGSGNSQVVLIRLLPDGTFDSSFGTAGITLTDLYPTGPNIEIGSSVVVQPDEKIVLAVNIGSIFIGSGGGFALLRFEANGILDSSFASNGISVDTIGNISGCRNVALQDSGSILIAGIRGDSFNGYSLALCQYNPQGQLDNLFANNGVFLSALNNNPVFFNTLKIQTDHKIIVAGQWGDSLLLMRFIQQGQPDITFASQGITFALFNSWYSRADHIYLYPNDKITLLGYTSNGIDTSKVFIARYNNDISNGIQSETNVNQFGVIVYPNPATNQFTIAFANNFTKVVATIFDITGKAIYKTSAPQTQMIEVNTIDFAEGVYLLQIQSDKYILTKKVIVAK